MNQDHHISNLADLEQLISRYFDGETTVQEEQALKNCLAEYRWNSDMIDEARFTMGYFMSRRQHKRRINRTNLRLSITGIAASMTILLASGSYALWHRQQSSDDVCIAYVNGDVIESNDGVMALIEKDLSNLRTVSTGMRTQLSSLSEAIELDNE